MKFEGRPVQALLDTGSPVTIVSLEFLLQTLAKQRPASQTVAEWQVAVKARLQPPSVTLQSYGGKELNIVRQVSTVVSRGDHDCEAIILVQKTHLLTSWLGLTFSRSWDFSSCSQVQKKPLLTSFRRRCGSSVQWNLKISGQ